MPRWNPELRALLDDVPIEGAAAVRRELSPWTKALIVQRGSAEDLTHAVGQCCECWGGGCFLLVPGKISAGFTEVDPLWQRLIIQVDPDWLDLRGLPPCRLGPTR